MKELLEMDLHERIHTGSIRILRVPGGWIYYYDIVRRNVTEGTDGTFVPEPSNHQFPGMNEDLAHIFIEVLTEYIEQKYLEVNIPTKD